MSRTWRSFTLLELFKEGPLNLVCDSEYVVKVQRTDLILNCFFVFVFSSFLNKKGGKVGKTPQNQLSKALYVMNHLYLSGAAQICPVMKHFASVTLKHAKSERTYISYGQITSQWSMEKATSIDKLGERLCLCLYRSRVTMVAGTKRETCVILLTMIAAAAAVWMPAQTRLTCVLLQPT